MLRFFQPEKTNDNHYTLLINDLHQTAQDLQDAYRNLENVIDPDLIDCADALQISSYKHPQL